MSDIGIPISGDIVERLMRRAHSLNGRPVADGDGNTYIPGEYTRKDAALDQEAYAEITRLRDALREIAEHQPDYDYIGRRGDRLIYRKGPGSPYDEGRQDEAALLSGRARKALEGGDAA